MKKRIVIDEIFENGMRVLVADEKDGGWDDEIDIFMSRDELEKELNELINGQIYEGRVWIVDDDGAKDITEETKARIKLKVSELLRRNDRIGF